jgi:hypothetical protein
VFDISIKSRDNGFCPLERVVFLQIIFANVPSFSQQCASEVCFSELVLILCTSTVPAPIFGHPAHLPTVPTSSHRNVRSTLEEIHDPSPPCPYLPMYKYPYLSSLLMPLPQISSSYARTIGDFGGRDVKEYKYNLKLAKVIHAKSASDQKKAAWSGASRVPPS